MNYKHIRRCMALLVLAVSLWTNLLVASAATYKEGSRGSEVTYIQTQLQALGYFQDTVTGYYGPVTKAAVLKFQRASGLTATGITDEATYKLLSSSNAATATVPVVANTSAQTNAIRDLKKGDSGSDVSAMQQSMLKLGIFNEVCTGYYGAVTFNSVLAFQQANGIKATGIADKATQNAINAAAAGDTAAVSADQGQVGIINGVLMRELKQGCEGPDVLLVQQILFLHRYLRVEPTGFFGNATAEAVTSMQRDLGLVQDGKVSSTTYTVMMSRIGTVSRGDVPSSNLADTPATAPTPEPTAAVQMTPPVVASSNAEMADWFKDVSGAMPVNNIYIVTDVASGKSFTVKRLGGTNHSDVEPLTVNDTAVMREIRGEWTWERRALIVKLANGRLIAASWNAMPHGDQSIKDNGYNGHFCIHFYNSRTHGTNFLDPDHQAMVRAAAGR